jgi:hypothetical protein
MEDCHSAIPTRYTPCPSILSAQRATTTDSKRNIILTGIVHPNIDLPSESFLYILNELVDLGTGIDVTLERLDGNAVLGRELGGDGGSIGRGVRYGDISTGYKRQITSSEANQHPVDGSRCSRQG